MSAGFYTRNALRHYPLVSASDLPTALLVDAGFTVDQDTGFVPSVHPVRIDQAARASGGWAVTVSGPPDVPALVFYVADGWGEWATVWADGTRTGSSSSSAAGGGVPAAWFGFLVFGREADWQAILPSGVLTPSGALLEAARSAISRGLVRSVRLANRDRLRVSEPYCGSASGSVELPTSVDRPYREWASSLTSGRLDLSEGHNLSVRLRDGQITLAARPGYGAGEVCEEVPTRAGEVPPEGSALLTGGPTCGELVRTVNGLPGRSVLISGGRGVFVTDDAAAGTVYFDVDPSVIPAPAGSSSAGG